MADPGFPVGGADLVGGANSQGGCFKNLYVKMKESGSLGARAGGAPLDPPMTWSLKLSAMWAEFQNN